MRLTSFSHMQTILYVPGTLTKTFLRNKNLHLQQKKKEAVENFSKQWSSLVEKDTVADYETSSHQCA